MSLNAGIVGLPNVGKSTIFNALTRAGAKVENFPFCTIEPNHGIVPVPDERLTTLARLVEARKVTPATLEVVDIAGLVRGAHKGEGLGNQFLGQIREVDAIIHVLRCFKGEVAHVDGSIDPIRDKEAIELELALADLETVQRRQEKLARELKVGLKGAKEQAPILERFRETLEQGRALRSLELDDKERELTRAFGLLTAKPVLYVANVDEDQLREPDRVLEALRERLAADGEVWVELTGEMEMEIASLDDPEEQAMFLADLGLDEPGLDRVVRKSYEMLGLITFYTAGEKETRAWAIKRGTTAPKAAGKIHTDFEKGFIRAEVIRYDDYVRLGSEAAVREQGLMRLEGKEYVIQDGDVVHFRFNV